MTVKKPAFIYSVIVKALKESRLRRDMANVEEPAIDKYTTAVITDMCSEAVADDSDIKNFRGTCEWILETILRLRRESMPMISPTCRHRLVKEGLMVEGEDLAANNMNEKLSVG
jgi:hypothetical protein